MKKKIDEYIILEKIRDVIYNNIDFEKDVGVISGISGTMIFTLLLAKLLKSDEEYEKAKELINLCINKINNGYNFPTFGRGITGFLWTLQFLEEKKIVEINNDSFFSQLDDSISDLMISDIKNGNYDLLHGALGYGMLFLKRYKNTQDLDLKQKYKSKIIHLIKLLDESKIENEKGIAWSIPRNFGKEDEVNIDLGLAHGMSSILSFLSLVYKENIDTNRIEYLLKSTSKFVLSTKRTKKNRISLFPAYECLSHKKEDYPSRLSWCYGDLGIGLSLLKAGESIKDQNIKKEAIDILLHSSKRRSLEENSVIDAGLCHGAYGLFHIYGKLFKSTQITDFEKASKYWKEIGDSMINFDQNQDIYYHIHLGDRDWSKPYSLLEGVTGIGLSIISSLTDYEIEWDQCLLI